MIEEGFQWSDQLERTLKLCKRSGARAPGPKTKAGQVESREVGKSFVPRVLGKNRKNVPLAAELFEFGVIWMLREIELAAIETEHISLDYKCVTFTLPVSQGGREKGAPASLQQQCLRRQLPLLHVDATPRPRGSSGPEQSLHQQKKAPCSKITAGQGLEVFVRHEGVGTFSEKDRRFEIHQKRLGHAIAQVAYLGRWKSAVIYEYAKEALESLPVNNGDISGRAVTGSTRAKS